MYVLYDSVCIADDLLCSSDVDSVADLVAFASDSVGGQSLEVSEGTQIATVTYPSIDEVEVPEVEIDDGDLEDGGEIIDQGDSGDESENPSVDDSDLEDGQEIIDGDDTGETEEMTITDVYNVTVTQSYLLAVIAFGVFLTCGILLGKALWDRLKQ